MSSRSTSYSCWSCRALAEQVDPCPGAVELDIGVVDRVSRDIRFRRSEFTVRVAIGYGARAPGADYLTGPANVELPLLGLE
jgi:hypothetical protein